METPTGERLIPELQREELIYAEHLARYLLAAQLAPRRRVLDAGCGEGYGTALLASRGASSVVGVDTDEETVAAARRRYGLDFRVADVAELPFDAESFDAVVCFETIEHVVDPSRAVAEFRRVLASDGLLVISTPNAAEYLVENEFHAHEYSPAEFDELLAAHFPDRHRLYQQNWLLSAILDERQLRMDGADSALDLELAKAVGSEPGRELYSVVICGPLDHAPREVAVASGIYEANLMAADLVDAERERKAWQERAAIAERQRQTWEEEAATSERQRQAWQERATKAERQREAWEERARKAEENAEGWERHAREVEREFADAIRAIEASLSWRITKPLRFLKALFRRSEHRG